MDIVVTGRHCTINPELKELVHERIATVERLRDRVIRAEVDFTADDATKDPSHAISVQLTLRSRGPVVRAEAKASDKTAAFEMALDRLKAQLRKAADRRKTHRGLRNGPAAEPVAPVAEPEAEDEAPETVEVAGLVVTNDVSARDIQLPQTQFYEAKSYPTFTPVGPALVLLTAAELKRFGELRLQLRVNGELRQDMRVAGDMIYSPLQALQSLTRFQDLSAGDLVLTGTPVGTARVEFGDLPLQVSLAEPGHVLHQQVARATDPGRRQGGALVTHAGDVAQFGSKLRVRQSAGRCDPLCSGFSLVTHRGVFRIAAAGEVQ